MGSKLSSGSAIHGEQGSRMVCAFRIWGLHVSLRQASEIRLYNFLSLSDDFLGSQDLPASVGQLSVLIHQACRYLRIGVAAKK